MKYLFIWNTGFVSLNSISMIFKRPLPRLFTSANSFVPVRRKYTPGLRNAIRLVYNTLNYVIFYFRTSTYFYTKLYFVDYKQKIQWSKKTTSRRKSARFFKIHCRLIKEPFIKSLRWDFVPDVLECPSK